MRALFAAVQFSIAFWAGAGEFNSRRQRGGAIEAPRGGDVLDEARQAGAGDIDGRTGALWLRTVIAERLGIAVRIHVPVLTVLAVVVHGEESSGLEGERTFYFNEMRTDRRDGPSTLLIRGTLVKAVSVGNPKGRRPATTGFGACQCCKYIFTTKQVQFASE